MFKDIFDKIEDNVNLVGLTEELKSIYISSYMLKKEGVNIVYVKNTLYDVNKSYNSLSYHFENTFMYPIEDMNLRKIDMASPELKTIRIETVNSIKKNPNNNIVITNLTGYLKTISSLRDIEKNTITLENNNRELEDLIKELINLGYNKENFVNQTGDFSIKGYILDVFPVDFENPVRVEFFGDEIVSIREFDLDSQKSIRTIEQVKILPNKEIFGTKTLSESLDNVVVVFDDIKNLEKTYSKNIETDLNYYDNEFIKNYSKETKKINFSPFEDGLFENRQIFDSSENYFLKTKDDENLKNLFSRLEEGYKIILCIDSEEKARKLYNKLSLNSDKFILTNELKIYKEKINIIYKKISEGFTIGKLMVLNYNELIGVKQNIKNYKTKFKVGKKIKTLDELNVGDYVVHELYGIGVYKGIKTIMKKEVLKDFIQIEYKNNDKVYIPVEKIDYINKYASADTKAVKINKIGSSEWSKTKLKAQNRAKKVAYDLINLYATREQEIGYSFPEDDEYQTEFEKEFSFVPTIDQVKATEEIKRDMELAKPMDRLLCGDVGFGKTEVAFRAIYKAVSSSKQAMILCPTTILSRQHYANARERFSLQPVSFAILNRFTTDKEAKYILKKFSEGKMDVLIGTHRILSDDVVPKDLGLLIIDEEQRFGVNHKEKIKTLKKGVDVLSLSATPIPRTVQMTMSGMRNLSKIETPPNNRYPVQTYVVEEDYDLIKNAIYNEVSRGGQAFILNNDIKSMNLVKEKLLKVMPDIKIQLVHGKMNKHEIENAMTSFSKREFDILLCTTIIETGIDIPNVNTLIILDSENFGLSQLYQLRGRVGRSDKVAYCYLTYKKSRILSEIATKRLKIIKDFSALGSGLSVSVRDLSLRGAGDIIGSEQSGFISTVGVDLFMKMLAEEVSKLKGEEKTLTQTIEKPPIIDVDTHIFPDFDENTKVEVHRRINEIDSYDKLEEVKLELEDRFGKLDEEIIIYMHEELLERKAMDLGISTINRKRNEVEVVLEKDTHQNIQMDELFHCLYDVENNIKIKSRGSQVLIVFNKEESSKHHVYLLLDILECIVNSKTT